MTTGVEQSSNELLRRRAAELGQIETFASTTCIVDNRRMAIDGTFVERQYGCMNSEALKSMMCTMTANGESWES